MHTFKRCSTPSKPWSFIKVIITGVIIWAFIIIFSSIFWSVCAVIRIVMKYASSETEWEWVEIRNVVLFIRCTFALGTLRYSKRTVDDHHQNLLQLHHAHSWQVIDTIQFLTRTQSNNNQESASSVNTRYYMVEERRLMRMSPAVRDFFTHIRSHCLSILGSIKGTFEESSLEGRITFSICFTFFSTQSDHCSIRYNVTFVQAIHLNPSNSLVGISLRVLVTFWYNSSLYNELFPPNDVLSFPTNQRPLGAKFEEYLGCACQSC